MKVRNIMSRENRLFLCKVQKQAKVDYDATSQNVSDLGQCVY